MGPVSATAIEVNNREEGGFCNDQPASTNAWIRMGWERTGNRDDGVWGDRGGSRNGGPL